MSAFRLGPLDVQQRIASGGMGDIWRGVHRVQDIPVAIKVIRTEASGDPRFRRAFQQEVRAVAQLDHPGIITLFDIGEVSEAVHEASAGAFGLGSPYLVMEYLERGSLESLPLPLPWTTTLQVLQDVLQGLAHAHARGITHRDLKPGNVLLVDSGSGSAVRLTDFGIAFSASERLPTEATGSAVGTPAYMAPEQFMGEWRDFGPWTDLYALGCLAYQLASGFVPFRHHDVMRLATDHLEQDPPELVCPPDYPDGFNAWVGKLLEKKMADRYSRCADAAIALEALTSSARISRTTFTAENRTSDAKSRRPFKLIGAGLRLFGLRTIPMVDREAERERMWAMFDRVVERGMPGVVVLEGAAGTGKSRLAEWFCERTHELGVADYLRAEHDRARQRQSGLSRMLAAAWSCQGATVDELQERVATILVAAGIASRAVAQALVEFLAPVCIRHDYSPGMFHEFQSRNARFDVLFEVLRKVYRDRPLIIWLDDVHWGSDALLFLRYVMARSSLKPMRLMAVVTARDDLLVEVPDAARLLDDLCLEENVDRVAVAPLTAADCARLVSNLLYLEGDLAHRVALRSGGNPLYATQLVGDWVNRGILEPATGGFVLAEPMEPVIPNDVHAVWVQRLERVLDESTELLVRSSTHGAERIDMQVALELACALGGRVDQAEWVAACSLARVTDAGPALESLLASRMARVEVDGWSYSHSMLRDTIERIAREKRRWTAHNRRCADMLEQRRAVPHWGDSERIGRHRFEAEEFDAALRPLLRGARERLRLEEYPAAIWLLTLYDEAVDRLEAPAADRRRVDGQLLRAEISCIRRELREAEMLATKVRAMATTPDMQRFAAQALLMLARVHRHQGRLHTSVGEFAEAQRALRVTGPRQMLAAGLSEWGEALLEIGQLDNASRVLKEAQEIYEDIGQLIPWTEGHLRMAQIALRQGDAKLAATLSKRVHAFAKREALNRLEAAAWTSLGEIQMSEKVFDLAESSLDESIELFEQLGLTRQALYPRSLKMLIWLESGAVDKAQSAFAKLRKDPDFDTARTSELLIHCIGLAAGIDGAADDFQARLDRAAARIAEVEELAPNVVKCLRLAVERAAQHGFPDRAARVERLQTSVVTDRLNEGPGGTTP
jgi:eukaryotic-like serine/threonine-protein kinase